MDPVGDLGNSTDGPLATDPVTLNWPTATATGVLLLEEKGDRRGGQYLGCMAGDVNRTDEATELFIPG